MTEIELKFVIDEPMAGRVWTRAKELKLVSGSRKTRTVRSVYLDTPEYVLKDSGITLRLRRLGRRWTQTVKTKAKPHGGLSQVDELESAAPGGRLCLETIPDAAVRDEIIRRVNGSPLQPVFETVMKRTGSELSLSEGTRAELATDVGEIRAEGRSAELREAEIKFVEGRRADLFDIAHALFPNGGLRFSRVSKADRGYLLAAEGRIDSPLAPRKAEAIALDPTQTAEQAARDILRECFDQITANMLVVQKLDDPEGPHQLRVGLRRLRSAFSVFTLVLQSPELSRLGEEARWLGEEVGRLRDIDVVNDIVRREADSHPGEPGLSALADGLSEQAAEVRGQLRKCLTEARAQAFVIDLARFVETRGWLVPEDFGRTERLAALSVLAESALSKRWRKVSKRARGLKTLDVGQRHELRKELKKLRYAVEFLSPLFLAKRVEPFVKRLKKLQTVFGDLNDAATVKAMFARTEVRCGSDLLGQRAIGWVIGASQAHAEYSWAGARAMWRDLKETRPFWK